jgi:electron transport complex protein RnfE
VNDLEIQAQRKGMVWENNPVLIQLLGLSPVLAVSSTLAYGIGLGIATCLVYVDTR